MFHTILLCSPTSSPCSRSSMLLNHQLLHDPRPRVYLTKKFIVPQIIPYHPLSITSNYHLLYFQTINQIKISRLTLSSHNLYMQLAKFHQTCGTHINRILKKKPNLNTQHQNILEATWSNPTTFVHPQSSQTTLEYHCINMNDHKQDATKFNFLNSSNLFGPLVLLVPSDLLACPTYSTHLGYLTYFFSFKPLRAHVSSRCPNLSGRLNSTSGSSSWIGS